MKKPREFWVVQDLVTKEVISTDTEHRMQVHAETFQVIEKQAYDKAVEELLLVDRDSHEAGMPNHRVRKTLKELGEME